MNVDHEMWLIHSPYPDKSWRGIEKCMELPDFTGSNISSILPLFESKTLALEFIKKVDPSNSNRWVPVKVTLAIPCVGDLPQYN